jgi:hypothetical protein
MMKKILFSGLISCSLLVAVQTRAQSISDEQQPVILSTVDHSAFYAYPENNIAILRWGAGNETGVDHYVIERSGDSVHFDPLHEVVSKDASEGDSSYEDSDPYPGTPIHFYRLVTVMKDGATMYSPAIKVVIDNANTPFLAPTVVHMGATLWMKNYHDQLLTVNFFTAGGQLLKSVLVNSSSFNINTTGWARGIVFYRISDETHPLVDAGKIMIL